MPPATECSAENKACHSSAVNISDTERTVSLAVGGLCALVGLSRLSLTNLLAMGIGGALIYRGMTGHCDVYQALEMSTADTHPQR